MPLSGHNSNSANSILVTNTRLMLLSTRRFVFGTLRSHWEKWQPRLWKVLQYSCQRGVDVCIYKGIFDSWLSPWDCVILQDNNFVSIIISPDRYSDVTHDEISVCLAIWLMWWTNIIVIRMINTPAHVLSPGWLLCKRSGPTSTEVFQHAYSSYQALSLPLIFHQVNFWQPDVTDLISIDAK